MITQDSIEALKARLDVVDVVGSYIELKKAGGNFKAPCPFHDEKSPSFVVSPQKQIYHCFGCGAGGDAVKFVMEYEKLNYPEALEKLANSYNFTLSYTDNKHNKPRSKLMDRVNEWYQHLLSSNKTALSYLKDRGIYESSIEKFGVGYAPDSSSTINFIKSQHFNMGEAVEMGIVGYNSERNQTYARFIERITFPIYSTNGTLVGFGGRTITNHQAKYVNSPETPYFNKSRLLYAYHLARQAIYKHKEIIITEGYLDVIMLHQAGFTNAVATLGTALTNEHLPLLRKGDPKIVMAYDGDKAGRAAALKASKLLSASGFDGGVVVFEGGLDPADMVKGGKVEELASMFREVKPFIEFVLDEVLSLYNLKDPKAKESCMQEGVAYLKTLSPILQEEYKTYLASRLGSFGINPSLVKLTNQTNIKQNTQPLNNNRYRDMWELSLIKTVIEHPEFIDLILDVIEPSLLQFHSNEFTLALHGKTDAPQIMAIMVDDSINSLEDEKSLTAELITFLTKHYERELKKINMANISFEQKAFYIRKYRGKMARLKRGELVSLSD
jgi:DNA primase